MLPAVNHLGDLLEQIRSGDSDKYGQMAAVMGGSDAPGPKDHPVDPNADIGKMSDLQDPWGVDPDGYDPMTRHGITLDEEAMKSLIQARRQGYNPFPFIGGAYRSIADSNALYNSRYTNGVKHPGVLPAAPGGQSMHNFGLAFDAGSLPNRVASFLEQNGWFNGASFGDPVHYSYYRQG